MKNIYSFLKCVVFCVLSRYPSPLTLIATAQENYMHIIPRQTYTSHTFIKGVLAPPLRQTNQMQNVKTFPFNKWPPISNSL